MSTSLVAERAALDARFALALTAAQTVEPTFKLVDANDNTAHTASEPKELDPDGYFLFVYTRSVTSRRLGLGPTHWRRYLSNVYVDVIVPRRIGRTVVLAAAQAVIDSTAFVGNADGLEFAEEPPVPASPARDGSSYILKILFPYWRDELRSAA